MGNEKPDLQALRDRIQRAQLKSQQEHNNLMAVLKEYPIFTRTAQLELAIDAGDHLPRTFTVALLNVRRERLNPDLPELAAFDLWT